jgi:transcriptional regulator with XRE-family HTH domain
MIASGTWIKAERKKENMQVSDLAKLSKLDSVRIAEIEEEKRVASPSEIKLIYNALGSQPEYPRPKICLPLNPFLSEYLQKYPEEHACIVGFKKYLNNFLYLYYVGINTKHTEGTRCDIVFRSTLKEANDWSRDQGLTNSSCQK